MALTVTIVGLAAAATEVEPVAETPGHAAQTAKPDNPVLPVPAELAWSAGMFVLLWALMKFWLVKPITSTMEARAEKVRSDLGEGARLREEAASVLAQHESSLAATRSEASRIIETARAEAEEQRRQILATAEAEVGELRTAASAEVAQAKADALASMGETVAAVAVQAAGIVMQKQLDGAGQRAVVDEYLNRVSPN